MRKAKAVSFVLATILYLSLCSYGQETKQDSAKPEPHAKTEKAAFKFADVEYFHRFTDKDLHEYTPAGQQDLEKFADMVSINYYRTAKDGESLAVIANNVLGLYKKNQGVVLRTNSVPRTKEKPAEHLIVVAFIRPTFQEVAFARFRMHKGIGTSVVYSHRVYGDNAKDEMKGWLKKTGSDMEQAVTTWDDMPELPIEK